MKIHTETRNKALIAVFNFLGLSPSYNQILRIEDQLAAAICQQYRLDGAVAPPPLQKGRFTMAATDNIDHNSSSNTAMTSMHQTSLSAIQVGPTDANQSKRGKISIPIVASDCKLPDAYVVVPWIDIQTTNIKVPWRPKIFDTSKRVTEDGKEEEMVWLKKATSLLLKLLRYSLLLSLQMQLPQQKE